MIKAIVFDLEGTLFTSKALSQAHLSRIIDLLSKRKQVKNKKALMMLKSRRERLAKRLGYTPSLTKTVEVFGISRQEFFEEIAKVDPRDFLKLDAELIETLRLLRDKGLKIALLTNVSYEYTKKILRALGVEEIFTHLITGSDVVHVKPAIEPFQKTLKILDLNPSHVLMVGDRAEIDLAPAKGLGMKTALVIKHSKPKDINTRIVDIVLHDVGDLIKYF